MSNFFMSAFKGTSVSSSEKSLFISPHFRIELLEVSFVSALCFLTRSFLDEWCTHYLLCSHSPGLVWPEIVLPLTIKTAELQI